MRTGSRFPVALLCVVLAIPSVSRGQDIPYFRFKAGKDAAGKPDTKPTTSSLAFASTSQFPAGVARGDSYTLPFTTTGGGGDHAVTAAGLPPNGRVAKTGPRSFVLVGSLHDLGSWNPVLTLTDSAGSVPATFALRNLSLADVAQPLDFAEAVPPVQGMRVGQPASGSRYVPRGGHAPYVMTLSGAPSGLRVATVDGDPGAYHVVGAPFVTVASASATVKVTDAYGATATRSFPVTVSEFAGPPLAFARTANLPAEFPANEERTGSFEATGGVAPYEMEILGAPSTLVMQPDTSNEARAVWSVVGAVSSGPVTISSARVRLRDSAGATAEHPLPPFTVTGVEEPLAFSRADPVPALVTPETDLSSVTFSATGGTAPYDMEIVGNPYNDLSLTTAYWDPVRADWTLSAYLSPGLHRNVLVKLSDANGKVVYHRIPDFYVEGGALRVSTEFKDNVAPSYDVPTKPWIGGGVVGGVGPYVAAVTSGQSNVSFDEASSGSGWFSLTVNDVTKPYDAHGVVVRVTDANGDAVAFQPFDVSMRSRISSCSGPPDPVYGQVGQTSAAATFTWAGGVWPYTLATTGLPPSMGATLATGSDVTEARMSLRPTAAVDFVQGAKLVVTDSYGSSCEMPFTAMATGADGVQPVTLSDTTWNSVANGSGERLTTDAWIAIEQVGQEV